MPPGITISSAYYENGEYRVLKYWHISDFADERQVFAQNFGEVLKSYNGN